MFRKKFSIFAFEHLFETVVQMKETPKNTEEIILEAAHKIFKQKGFDGATVQDIATEAGTPKSMVNYYFRSKEKLFSGIFHREFINFLSGLVAFINSDASLKEKIKKIVAFDIDRLTQLPELPVFIINEIHRNPEIVFKNIESIPVKKLLAGLNEQIKLEIKKGSIKKINAEDLLINIQSLTIFPILAKPMLMNIFKLNEKAYSAMMEKRKTDVVEIIWQSIKK